MYGGNFLNLKMTLELCHWSFQWIWMRFRVVRSALWLVRPQHASTLKSGCVLYPHTARCGETELGMSFVVSVQSLQETRLVTVVKSCYTEVFMREDLQVWNWTLYFWGDEWWSFLYDCDPNVLVYTYGSLAYLEACSGFYLKKLKGFKTFSCYKASSHSLKHAVQKWPRA